MANLKHSDIKNRNKILMTVIWSHLKGNKDPYLSVNIKQVIHNGKRINDYQDQKQVIKQINNDFSFLLDCHLCNLDDYSMHMIANGIYFFELTKKHTLEKPFTFEDNQEKINQCYDHIKVTFDQLFKMINLGLADYNEFFKRLNKNGIVNNFLKHCENNRKSIYFKSFNQTFDLLKKHIDQWKKAKNKMKYTTLPRRSDLWTIERFSEYSSLPVDQVKDLFFQQDYKQILTNHFEETAKNNKIELDRLTEQYNIEIVHG